MSIRKASAEELTGKMRFFLASIEANPLATDSELSRVVGASKDAVKRRIRRLKAKRLIASVQIVSRRASLLKTRAVVGLSIDRRSLAKGNSRQDYAEFVRFLFSDLPKSEDWSKVKRSFGDAAEARIEAAFSVTGEIDVLLVIAATGPEIVTGLVTDLIDQLQGVTKSVTYNVINAEFFPASLLQGSTTG